MGSLAIFLLAVQFLAVCLGESNETTDCPIPFIPLSDRCIFAYPFIESTWEEMRYFCHDLRADLLVVNEANFFHDLLSFLRSEGFQVNAIAKNVINVYDRNCFHESSLAEGVQPLLSTALGSAVPIWKSSSTKKEAIVYGIDQHDYWIGAHDRLGEGAWIWVDGVRVELGSPFWALNWSPDLLVYILEPQGGELENCLFLDTTRALYFDDGDCLAPKSVICEYLQ